MLDHNLETIRLMRQFGFKGYFGDATRPDLLQAAGIQEAQMLVVAIDDKHQITELVRYVRSTYPHVHVLARAVDRPHVYELWAAGCRDIVRETFDSAVRMGRSAFEALGATHEEAMAMAAGFVDDDRASMILLAGSFRADVPATENAEYMEKARKAMPTGAARAPRRF